MTRQRLDLLLIAEKVAEAAMRRAAGLGYRLDGVPASLQPAAEEIVERLAKDLAEVDEKGILRCRVCGKGPFTRKGLYLHLRRVHSDVVVEEARRLLEDAIWRRTVALEAGAGR